MEKRLKKAMDISKRERGKKTEELAALINMVLSLSSQLDSQKKEQKRLAKELEKMNDAIYQVKAKMVEEWEWLEKKALPRVKAACEIARLNWMETSWILVLRGGPSSSMGKERRRREEKQWP